MPALVAIYVAMRVYHGAAVCLDGDEIFSVGVSSHDWKGLMAAIGRDAIHPPLFYSLLKIWIFAGGDSLVWVRLFPALFSTLAIIPVLLLGRGLHFRRVEIEVTVGLAAIHPVLVYYSQHVRMYTLLMLCALTSLWAFHRVIRSGSRSPASRYAALTLVNVVSVYSHYYAWMIVGLECWYLIFWKRACLRRFLVSTFVVLAAFTPWVYWAGRYVLAKGGLSSNLEWIRKPDAGALAWFFVDMAGFGDFPSIGKWAVAGLASLVAVAACAIWLRRRTLRTARFAYIARFLLFFALGSVAVAFAASRLLPSSVWGHRHLIYFVFPMLMLVTSAYSRLHSRAVRLTGAALCAVWACMAITHHLEGDDKKTPFDTLVVRMLAQEAGTQGPVPFYSVDKYLHYTIWFYLETLKAGRITGFAAPILAADRGKLAVEAARIQVRNPVSIDEARGTHFWVGYSSARKEKLPPEAILTQRGCRTGADVTVRDRYHSSTIFPVWCGAAP